MARNKSKVKLSTKTPLPRVVLSISSNSSDRTPIPYDVLSDIFVLLAQPDLIRCLRVSKDIHNLVVPILYPTLYSTLSIDLSVPINPISINNVPITSIWGHNKIITIPQSLLPVGYTHLPLVSQIHGIESLPNRFDYTSFLTLTSHDRIECRDLPSLVMPNLHTLRIYSGLHENHLNLCHYHSIASPPNHTTSTSNPLPKPIGCCPLIINLHPRRLILGDHSTTLSGSWYGLWSAPLLFPPFIKELIILVGMLTNARAQRRSVSILSTLVSGLPGSVDKTVFVATLDAAGWKQLHLASINYVDLAAKLSRMDHALATLHACMSETKTIEIVCATIRLSQGDTPVTRSVADASLRQWLVSHGSSVERSHRRLDVLSYIGEKAFEEREGWYRLAKEEWDTSELVAKLRRIRAWNQEEEIVKQLDWNDSPLVYKMAIVVIFLVLATIAVVAVGILCWWVLPALLRVGWWILCRGCAWGWRVLWPLTEGVWWMLGAAWNIMFYIVLMGAIVWAVSLLSEKIV